MNWGDDAQAVLLTLKLALVVTVLLLAFGTPLAWWLAHTRSRWKAPLSALVALPLVLPPTVLGYYLLVVLSRHSAVGAQKAEDRAGHVRPPFIVSIRSAAAVASP